MDHHSSRGLQQFKNFVGIKFQLYNSLFTSLPFHRIEKTGILLSLLQNICEEGYRKNMSPEQIIVEFFQKHTSISKEEEQHDLLFRFIQYVERQVVLFDALEDAGFRDVNDMAGIGTMKHLESAVIEQDKQKELTEKLKDFAIRLVLTAHPTQFYPGPVLGIIHDLAKALAENNTIQINTYLQQLGKTPFFKKQKPTPYDEAISLIWYLENIFYNAAGRILSFIRSQFPEAFSPTNPVIQLGFWPGGDRDGNPNVTCEITLKVADALRGSIIKSYYLEVRRLKRRLTFKGVDVLLAELEKQLYANIFIPGQRTELKRTDILEPLNQIREILVYQHNGLFLHLVDNLINKVLVFGLHFASLDIRQESSIHTKVIASLAEQARLNRKDFEGLDTTEKIHAIVSTNKNGLSFNEPLHADTIETMRSVKDIQRYNGVEGCHRYIISQCQRSENVMEVYTLFLYAGWNPDDMPIDIVPLFETVEDLRMSASTMTALYSNEVYRLHLAKRKMKQTIMLGFSDGTKDGGYLMANWSIYKCKEELTKISRDHQIDVVFFDGRGGPPARGGGKTHRFYASMGKNISNEEIQLTIQGQTVSSNFGTVDSAQYNIEQLINAGISNSIFSSREKTLDEKQHQLIHDLAEKGFEAYNELKNHPDFLEYLTQVSPLRFYSDTNIGSRPAKRGSSSKLELRDLRAIPFVGAWSQMKQNVTGYYGVGTAFEWLDKQGRFRELKDLYNQSLFFKTLIDNCEMAMKKSFFPLTAFLAGHAKFGELWKKIYQEYDLTLRYIFQLSGKNELMANYPVEQLSVQMRERIVLPLTTIQQFALSRIRAAEESSTPLKHKETYEKLVIRSSFGIINAGRNSV
ncbi:MAG TPA: phosphoenolpyruvate carboxylase [Flavitalea sp.]|nr:phosphoenolpyruvate carboxylase [Flavitalea sp.]